MKGVYKSMDKKVKGIFIDIAIVLGFSFLILVFSGTVRNFFPKLSAFVLMFEIVCGIIFWVIIICSIIGKKTLGHRISEKFEKNKKWIILICCFTVFSFILYFWNMNFNPYYYYPQIEINNKIQVEQYSEITNYYGIKNISNGKIVTKEKIIDTSKIGKKEVDLVIENKYGKKREFTYFIDVVEKLEKCEISFRDTHDNYLMGKDVLKTKSAKISQDSSGNPALSLTVKDKDKFFEITNKISKQENNIIVIWINYDKNNNSYDKDMYNCGNKESNCLSAATVSTGFSSDIIIPIGDNNIVDCINNSWN